MKTKSNTLVIHPKDVTTDCLSVIYEGRGWDVISDIYTSNSEIIDAIKSHDRIIMLGHGTPGGLLCGNGLFRFARYIIDSSHAKLLKTKETFSIWCNSDAFFRKYGLKGLHTGMIISETCEEGYVLNDIPLNEEQMAKNMELFCGTFAKYIDLDPEQMREKVLEEYVGDDPVTQFNRDNIVVL